QREHVAAVRRREGVRGGRARRSQGALGDQGAGTACECSRVTVFVSALAFGLAALVIGAALSCRGRWTWTAPATGLAAIVLIAVVAVRLPGHGATAAAALLLAVAAAVVALARARADLHPLLVVVPV